MRLLKHLKSSYLKKRSSILKNLTSQSRFEESAARMVNKLDLAVAPDEASSEQTIEIICLVYILSSLFRQFWRQCTFVTHCGLHEIWSQLPAKVPFNCSVNTEQGPNYFVITPSIYSVGRYWCVAFSLSDPNRHLSTITIADLVTKASESRSVTTWICMGLFRKKKK